MRELTSSCAAMRIRALSRTIVRFRSRRGVQSGLNLSPEGAQYDGLVGDHDRPKHVSPMARMRPKRTSGLAILIENQLIPKGIDKRHFLHPPRGLLATPRHRILAVLCRKCLAESANIGSWNSNLRDGRAVAMMLGKVKRTPRKRDTEVQRKVLPKAMLEVDFKTKKIDVETTSLHFIEAAENGYRRAKVGHDSLQSSISDGATVP